MLKQAVASKVAKLLMTCVCPVAGTTALSLGVPQVREAVHKATAPRQFAKPKTRVRPVVEAPALGDGVELATADVPCPSVTPFALSDLPSDSPLAAETAAAQSAEAGGPDPMARLSHVVFVPMSSPLMGDPPNAVPAVPEPATWVQLVLGFALIGGVARYRKAGAEPDGDREAA